MGSSSSYGLGATGGSNTVKLTTDNLPSHTHSASTASHSHTQPTHKHTIGVYDNEGADGPYCAGANGNNWTNSYPSTSSAGGETTGSASPVTTIGSTGKGTAFSILPPYLVVNIWKRLS